MDKGCSKVGFGLRSRHHCFYEKYIHCDIPDDEDIAILICRVQKHRHSVACRRHGQCRFHYPRPPSPITVIAHENLNVRSYQAKLQDVLDSCIAQTDVMCFTETFLKPHQHVGSVWAYHTSKDNSACHTIQQRESEVKRLEE